MHFAFIITMSNDEYINLCIDYEEQLAQNFKLDTIGKIIIYLAIYKKYLHNTLYII